jgi:hypothetical protein
MNTILEKVKDHFEEENKIKYSIWEIKEILQMTYGNKIERLNERNLSSKNKILIEIEILNFMSEFNIYLYRYNKHKEIQNE